MEENVSIAENYNTEVIASLEKPVNSVSGIIVLKGNLCEAGCIIKPSAASPHLMKHKGKAVVFETIEDYKARIDDPNLEVDEKQCVGVEACGSERISRYAGSGQYGATEEIISARCERYGADFGWKE